MASDISKLTSSLLQQKTQNAGKAADLSNANKTRESDKSSESLANKAIRDEVVISSGDLLEKVSKFQSLFEDVESVKRVLTTAVDTIETVLAKLEEAGGVAIQAKNGIANGLTPEKIAEFTERFSAVLNDVDNLAQNTGFAGENLLSGDNIEFYLGENPPVGFKVEGFKISSEGLELDNYELNTQEAASRAQNAITQYLDQVKAFRSQLFGDLQEVETRQEFSSATIDALIESAKNVASQQSVPLNDESAALLALQTQQILQNDSGESLALESQRNLLDQF